MPRTRGGTPGTQGLGRGLPYSIDGVSGTEIQGSSIPNTADVACYAETQGRGRSRRRGTLTPRRLSRGRGRSRGLDSSRLPDWLFKGTVDDLPDGVPLEVPLNVKRRRIWRSKGAEKVDQVLHHDVRGNGYPRANRLSRETAIAHEINFGSEEDESDDGESNPFFPRGIRMYLDADEADKSDTTPNFQWPLLPSASSAHPFPPPPDLSPANSPSELPVNSPAELPAISQSELVISQSELPAYLQSEFIVISQPESLVISQSELPVNSPSELQVISSTDLPAISTSELEAISPSEFLEISLSESPAIPPSELPALAESVGPELGPTDLFQFDWQPLPQPPIPPDYRRETFKGCAGSTINPTTPYEAFSTIWDSAIINHIVAETNKYAEQLLLKQANVGSLRDHSRIVDWSPIDADDLMLYLGLVMAMSIVQKNVLSEFWSKDTNIFSTPQFSSTMSRNKFQLISRCLHFNDNTRLDSEHISPGQAKLFKLEPIVEHLNKVFAGIYKLGQNVSLDESLTLWKGWLCIRQHIPNKAAKVGIKTYEVCESKTGYLYRFEVHVNSTEPEDPVCDSRMSGFVPRLVLRLLDGMENLGHTIWMDNYYNSPALARTLKSKGFDCVGTLRTNRLQVPTQLHQIKTGQFPMQKGDLVGCTSGDLDLFVWYDSARVAFVSTYHGMAVHHCPVENKTKPILVRDYNLCMGGVDLKDQVLSSYPIERKRLMVWYKKLFYRLLNVSVFNASIVMKSACKSANMSQRSFRTALVLEIMERHATSKKTIPRPMPVEAVTRLLPKSSVEHFTIPCDTIEGKKEKVRRTCIVCKKRVRSHCPKCNVALCFTPCAQKYHS